MRVLGIETSCDETAAAIVEVDAQRPERGIVLSDVVQSQFDDHVRFGGIVPELASRAHMRNIVPVVTKAMSDARCSLGSKNALAIDGVAVTNGPGLSGALLVGLQTGKALAYARSLPLVGVDHLEAHILAVALDRGERDSDRPRPLFPYVALLVSGGHTALYDVHGPSDMKLLGQTRDDAAGEAFDKGAKLLGLGYPGGPVIDRLAATGDAKAFPFPVGMRDRASLEFSFSGLKTSLARTVEKLGSSFDPATSANAPTELLRSICASYQHAIVETLSRKAIAACQQSGRTRLVLGGGVAANAGLRTRLASLCAKHAFELFVPPTSSCTDNAAMIAYAGALRLARGERDDLRLGIYSRAHGYKRGKIL